MLEPHMISLQPFWEGGVKNIGLLTDADAKIVAHSMHLVAKSSLQKCVPRTGMVGIAFSCDPNLPGSYCYGVLEGRGTTDYNGILDCFLVRFLPGEFSRLFGVSSLLPSQKGVPLKELFSVGTLEEEMAAAKSDEERQRLVERLIRSASSSVSFRKPREQEKQIAANAVRTILEHHGDIRMKELSQETLYSARYLQTLIQEHVGLPPKQLCSQIRFQNILRLLQNTHEPSLTLLAQQAGFYDQSHFTRVFKEYTGMCPSAFLQSRP